MKRLLFVVGTRPNFIKITQFPVLLRERKDIFDYRIVHTGQHYDDVMSKVFFEQFGVIPDTFLGITAKGRDEQIQQITTGIAEEIKRYSPDLVIVVGDVNSTLGAALGAAQAGCRLAHVESGLRSFDPEMPEEANRIATDKLADLCFVTEDSGVDNLKNEGKPVENIFLVGNTMIDTLVAFESEISRSDVLLRLEIREKEYILMTMHRPSTVDNESGLQDLLELIEHLSESGKVVFPVHPRTMKRLEQYGMKSRFDAIDNLIATPPMDYFSFQKLIACCMAVITDSGGIQEETTFRHVPCLTLRKNTERPVTIDLGTNVLVDFARDQIDAQLQQIRAGAYKKGSIPPLWDGRTTERIVQHLIEQL